MTNPAYRFAAGAETLPWLLALLAIGGCTTLTTAGSKVRTITAGQQEHSCQFLGTVEGVGYPASGGMGQAIAEARNGVGKAGGNGMRILSQDTRPVGNAQWSYITVEAWRCDFNAARRSLPPPIQPEDRGESAERLPDPRERVPALGSLEPAHGGSESEPADELLLFGGANNSVFLGCLTCSKFDTESVHNEHGQHGSRYGNVSIFNKHGEFGSRYSSYSPCNEHTSEAPAIVDRQGKYYGRLTLNRYNDQFPDGRLLAWLAAICRD